MTDYKKWAAFADGDDDDAASPAKALTGAAATLLGGKRVPPPSSRAVATRAAVAALRARATDTPVAVAAAVASKGSASVSAAEVARAGAAALSHEAAAAAAEAAAAQTERNKVASVKTALAAVAADLEAAACGPLAAEAPEARWPALAWRRLHASEHAAVAARLSEAGERLEACLAGVEVGSPGEERTGWRASVAEECRAAQERVQWLQCVADHHRGDFAGAAMALIPLIRADPSRGERWALRAHCFAAIGGAGGLAVAQLHVDRLLSALGVNPHHVADAAARADVATDLATIAAAAAPKVDAAMATIAADATPLAGAADCCPAPGLAPAPAPAQAETATAHAVGASVSALAHNALGASALAAAHHAHAESTTAAPAVTDSHRAGGTCASAAGSDAAPAQPAGDA
jgi:hypothetical protein